MRWCPRAAVLATALGLAGCGGGHGSGGSARRTVPVLPQAPGASGAAVFARDCQACHSLVGNESERKQGGDLRSYRMSRASLASFARVMPARRPLTAAELRAVVDYVFSAERAARR